MGAVMGVLIVFCGLVSVALFAGAPGQVSLVSSQRTSSSPPQIEVSLSLKNGGWVDVRADPIIQATFVLSNGSTFSREFYFDALTLPAGIVVRSSWNLSTPMGSYASVILTAYLRMRGPISETSRAYRLP
jgi:hypothetical protein